MPQHGGVDLVFTGASDLLRWTASVGIRRAPLRLRVDLPELGQEERLRWQLLLERSHNDCGCAAATAALLVFVAAVAVYATLFGFAGSGLSLWSVAILLVGAAVGVLYLGKLIGYAWSRRRLRRHACALVQLIGAQRR